MPLYGGCENEPTVSDSGQSEDSAWARNVSIVSHLLSQTHSIVIDCQCDSSTGHIDVPSDNFLWHEIIEGIT